MSPALVVTAYNYAHILKSSMMSYVSSQGFWLKVVTCPQNSVIIGSCIASPPIYDGYRVVSVH